jgi:GNAT superfamily N-acetyltransferase
MTRAVLNHLADTMTLPHPAKAYVSLKVAQLTAGLKKQRVTVDVEYDMGRVREVYRVDPATFDKGLYPALDPAYRKNAERWVLVARDDEGVPIATAGAVRDYIHSDYRQAWETGSLLIDAERLSDHSYANRFNDDWVPPQFTCTAPIASQIQGEVFGLYGVWTHPDRRRGGLSKQLVQLVYALAYASWSPGWLVGIVWPDLHSNVIWKSYGFSRAEHELTIRMPGVEALGMRLTAATRAELERFIGVPAIWANPRAFDENLAW